MNMKTLEFRLLVSLSAWSSKLVPSSMEVALSRGVAAAPRLPAKPAMLSVSKKALSTERGAEAAAAAAVAASTAAKGNFLSSLTPGSLLSLSLVFTWWWLLSLWFLLCLTLPLPLPLLFWWLLETPLLPL